MSIASSGPSKGCPRSSSPGRLQAAFVKGVVEASGLIKAKVTGELDRMTPGTRAFAGVGQADPLSLPAALSRERSHANGLITRTPAMTCPLLRSSVISTSHPAREAASTTMASQWEIPSDIDRAMDARTS